MKNRKYIFCRDKLAEKKKSYPICVCKCVRNPFSPAANNLANHSPFDIREIARASAAFEANLGYGPRHVGCHSYVIT